MAPMVTKVYRFARAVAFGCLSPLAEKNPLKLTAVAAPIVLSMARVILVVQLAVWARIGWKTPAMTLGWPYWTFGGILSIALPVVTVLSHAPTEAVLEFAKGVFDRLGVGEVQQVSPFPPLDKECERGEFSDMPKEQARA